MFRVAYVRGVNQALIDTGAVKYASEELAAEAADAVAEALPEQPVGEVAPEDTAEIASALVELSNNLEEAATNAADAAEAVAGGPGASVAEGVEEKISADVSRAAAILRAKLAQNPTGSTITGDKPEQQNTEPLSENAEAKMDLSNRPEEYANVGEDGVGNQEASGDGAVGSENVVQGKGMGPVAVDGTNSATDAIKGASVRDMIKNALNKRAMGTTITGTDPAQQNTQGQAAAISGEAKMEAAARPENYANKGEDGVGKSDEAAKERAAAVGKEEDHPGSMGPVGKDGTNTAIEQSKAAEEEAYMKQFKALSAKYAQVLPFWMDNNEKVAAIQYMMGIAPSDRDAIKSHIEKTAELPEALKEYVAKKKDNGDDKEEKKEEEKEEETKEASVSTAGDIIAKLRKIQ